jgi:hypothetical protein
MHVARLVPLLRPLLDRTSKDAVGTLLSSTCLLLVFSTFVHFWQADNEQLEASLAAATAQVSKLQAQLASLSQLQEGLQASLEGKQSAEASLMTQLTQVCVCATCWVEPEAIGAGPVCAPSQAALKLKAGMHMFAELV